jgi:sialic acid synthase SpsE
MEGNGNSFEIRSRAIGIGDVFFVIEEGMANLGNISRALEMIAAAAMTGADAIEFQLLKASDFAVRSHPRYELYESMELPDAGISELVRRSHDLGLCFVAAALTHTIVERLARSGCDAFNVNASDLTNPRVLDAVTATGRPFFLSLLLASEEEASWAIERVISRGAVSFGLLHGQHTMFSQPQGVAIEETNLGYLATLQERYGRPIGFIDHTPHAWMPAAAVIAGASVVTKHLAISRRDQGPDWQICLEPEEMRQAVAWARAALRSRTTLARQLASAEESDRRVMRKSVVAARNLARGLTLSPEDLAFKRPGTGLPPTRWTDLIGAELRRDLAADEQITLDDINRNLSSRA